jgi:hypothetical protein
MYRSVPVLLIPSTNLNFRALPSHALFFEIPGAYYSHLDNDHLCCTVSPDADNTHRESYSGDYRPRNLTRHKPLHLLPDLFAINVLIHLLSAHSAFAIAIVTQHLVARIHLSALPLPIRGLPGRSGSGHGFASEGAEDDVHESRRCYKYRSPEEVRVPLATGGQDVCEQKGRARDRSESFMMGQRDTGQIGESSRGARCGWECEQGGKSEGAEGVRESLRYDSISICI